MIGAPTDRATRDLKPSAPTTKRADLCRPPSVAACDPHGATLGVVEDVVDGEPGPQTGARFDGGVLEDRVEDMTARCDQQIDAVSVLDRPYDRLVDGMELDSAQCGRTGIQDPVQQSPALELDDAAPGDGVGRQRVARRARAVDDHDVVSRLRQQHRRRRTGAAGADDDYVGREMLAPSFLPDRDRVDLIDVLVHGDDDAGSPPVCAWNQREQIMETLWSRQGAQRAPPCASLVRR